MAPDHPRHSFTVQNSSMVGLDRKYLSQVVSNVSGGRNENSSSIGTSNYKIESNNKGSRQPNIVPAAPRQQQVGGMNNVYGMGMGMGSYPMGMGAMGGVGMGYGGCGMGMYNPMMSMMMGPMSVLYSINYFAMSLGQLCEMFGASSQTLMVLSHQLFASLHLLEVSIRQSSFRRWLQRKCKKSRLLRLLIVLASMALAHQFSCLIKHIIQQQLGNLLGSGASASAVPMIPAAATVPET
jgi:hypothetical protein